MLACPPLLTLHVLPLRGVVMVHAQPTFSNSYMGDTGYSNPYQQAERGSIQRGGGGGVPRENDLKFSYLAGVVDVDDRTRLERQLFRTTRGNCYVRFAEIEQPILDPVTGASVKKLVFIVFYKVP